MLSAYLSSNKCAESNIYKVCNFKCFSTCRMTPGGAKAQKRFKG